MGHTLRKVGPEQRELWAAYHDIRRAVLWEARGHYDYRADHPDETAEDHHAMVFCVDERPVGVVRIDLKKDAPEALFRRVAISAQDQRKGYGRELMEAAERFAADRGYVAYAANVAPDAIPFYLKLGYVLAPGSAGSKSPRMTKRRAS